MIAELVEPGVAIVEARDRGGPAPGLLREEAACVERAVEKRWREFATGRACARAALARIGHTRPEPILVGERGAPVWPESVVGSITHVDGFCAAAVARASEFAAVGIDAELNRPLPPDVGPMIASARELRALPRGESWPAVVFSAKEAVYKAWFPITRRWLGFDEAEVALHPRTGTFSAELRPRVAAPGEPARFEGRFAITHELVLTAVCVARR